MASPIVPTRPARTGGDYDAALRDWFLRTVARTALQNVQRVPENAVDPQTGKPSLVAGCHLYQGSIDAHGYGQIDHRFIAKDGRQRRMHVRAHVAAYILAFGPLPDGMAPDHQCHNRHPECRADKFGAGCLHRRCVRTSHLDAATPRQNLLNGHHPNAVARRNGTCRRGDPATAENTYTAPNGKRRCKGPRCRAAAKARKAKARDTAP